MVTAVLSSIKGLYEAARATRIGSALIGTPTRTLLTAGAVTYFATRNSSAADEIAKLRA